MKVASLALTVTLLSSTVALADFSIPDCDGLRRFPINVLENRIRRDETDRTLYQGFGVDLFEFTSDHAGQIIEATLACNIPHRSDRSYLTSRWSEIVDLADQVRADIELEIEGDRAEYLASQEPESSPPSPTSDAPARRPLGPAEDQRAAEQIHPFLIVYQIGSLCAENDVAFSDRDVETMDEAIRALVDRSNISDARLDQIWSVSAGFMETMSSQMTTDDCVETRQQANFMFRFPPSTTPNPFAR